MISLPGPNIQGPRTPGCSNHSMPRILSALSFDLKAQRLRLRGHTSLILTGVRLNFELFHISICTCKYYIQLRRVCAECTFSSCIKTPFSNGLPRYLLPSCIAPGAPAGGARGRGGGGRGRGAQHGGL